MKRAPLVLPSLPVVLQPQVACLRKFGAGTGRHSYFKDNAMNLSISIGPLVSLIAGILILIMPRLLNYIVAIYLIVIGLIGLFGVGTLKL
jgi:hypothetical protein